VPQSTFEWWALLRAAATLNVLAWLVVAAWIWQTRTQGTPELQRLRRWQLLLSAGYVLGCAWRSWMPVYDVPRLVMVNSFWSSVVVGRSVATLAELCFAAQWALLLRNVSRTAGDSVGLWLSRTLVPLILLAETFSWYSVLTTSNIGHVVEESLWGVCAAMLLGSFVLAWPRVDRSLRPLLALWCTAAFFYALYMFSVDVPMYWARWLADDALGRGLVGVADGWVDASTRWVVSHRWEDWRGEAVWMTTYFSVAVWISLTLAMVPALRRDEPR
jgi:hypothetical protein